jgi:hypothetical protein
MTDAEYDARMYIENDATAGERNSEAERLAAAVKPKRSVNGRIRGTKTRRITAKMRSFASLVAQGRAVGKHTERLTVWRMAKNTG